MQELLFDSPQARPDEEARVELDAYYTRPADARAALERWALVHADLGRASSRQPLRGWQVLEPSAGGGAWAMAAQHLGASVWVADINPQAPALRRMGRRMHVGDVLEPLPGHFPRRFDLVVGNPPFRRPTGRYNDKGDPITEDACEAHATRALQLGRQVLYLLPLAFIAGVAMEQFWQQHPARLVEVNARRWRFTGSGTAMWETAMFWWDQRESTTWDGSQRWSRHLYPR